MSTGTPFDVRPDAIYTDADIRLGLGITSARLAKARRSGRLRHARQGKTILYRGRWILDWLEAEAAGAKTPAAGAGA